jgi:hypothetical protein
MSQELPEKLQAYIDANPIEIDVDVEVSAQDLKRIISDGDIHEISSDHHALVLDVDSHELETWYLAKELYHEFSDEIDKEYHLQYGRDIDPDNTEMVADFLRDDLELHPHVDTNIARQINDTPMVAMFVVNSNYDCTVSYDRLEDGGYLWEMKERFGKGITDQDLLYEHGDVYGGSVLEFPFETTVGEFFAMKEQMNQAREITIPAGSAFGFFNDHGGSGSSFEKVTTADMRVPLQGKTQYDTIELKADVEHHYSHEQVYGGVSYEPTGITIGDQPVISQEVENPQQDDLYKAFLSQMAGVDDPRLQTIANDRALAPQEACEQLIGILHRENLVPSAPFSSISDVTEFAQQVHSHYQELGL